MDAVALGKRCEAARVAARPGAGIGASWLLAVVAAAVVGGGLAGCTGAGPPVGRADAAVPPDLTISATVLVGQGASSSAGAVNTEASAPAGPSVVAPATTPIADGAQRRHGRYIVFPDATLHADVGTSLRADVRPGVTRQLTTAQVEDLWTSARGLGLADPDNGELPGNDALVAAAPGQVVHIVTFLADGRSWRFVRRGAIDGPLDPATAPFVRELAALAWVTDEPPAARRPAVVRYDFGPDPYAMFRPKTPGSEGGRATP